MKKSPLLLIPCTVLLLNGCASWQQTASITLGAISEANKTTQEVAMSVLNSECQGTALQCHMEGDMSCPKLVLCQKKRDEVMKYILAVYQSVLAGTIALSFAEENTVDSYIQKSQKLLMEMYNLAHLFMPDILPKVVGLPGGK